MNIEKLVKAVEEKTGETIVQVTVQKRNLFNMNLRNNAIDLIRKFDVKYNYKFTKGQFPVSMHDSVIKQCTLNAIDVVLTTDLYSQDRDYWISLRELITDEFNELYKKRDD